MKKRFSFEKKKIKQTCFEWEWEENYYKSAGAEALKLICSNLDSFVYTFVLWTCDLYIFLALIVIITIKWQNYD